MRIYFERFIICLGCQDRVRQTTNTLPLDQLGRKISSSFIWEFADLHKECNCELKITAWRHGSYNLLNKSK